MADDGALMTLLVHRILRRSSGLPRLACAHPDRLRDGRVAWSCRDELQSAIPAALREPLRDMHNAIDHSRSQAQSVALTPNSFTPTVFETK